MTLALALVALAAFALAARSDDARTPVRAGVAAALAVLALATRAALDDANAHRARAAVALLALASFGWMAARRSRRAPLSRHRERGVAVALAVIAVGGFYGFKGPTSDQLFHHRDTFHYYLGSKYFRELGYKGIYECAAVAEAEVRGPDALRSRSMRDLERDEVVPASRALAASDRCHAAFGASRWSDFRSDVACFRSVCDDAYWNGIQTDHGYNPPPAWSMLGGVFSSLGPASETLLAALAMIDVGLLIAAFAVTGWAFGLRALCVTIVVWGCQEPGSFVWLQGTFLRQDWFFCLALGAALLRRRRWFSAGAALASGAALRAFPVVFLVGPSVVLARRALEARAIPMATRRFFAGAALIGGMWAVAGAFASPGAYPAWVSHIRQHDSVVATNRIGLQTLFEYGPTTRLEAFSQSADGDRAWLAARRAAAVRSSGARKLAALALIAGVLLALWSVRTPWIAALLSASLLFPLSSLNSYYYIVITLLGPLASLGARFERRLLAGIALMQVLVVMPALSWWWDDRYAVISVVIAALEGALLAPWLVRSLRSLRRAKLSGRAASAGP